MNNSDAHKLEIRTCKYQDAFRNVVESKKKLTTTIATDCSKYIVSEKKLGTGGKAMIN